MYSKLVPTILALAMSSVTLSAQAVNIPDNNFKNALLNHNPVIDTNGDGLILVSEAQAFTGSMDVSNQNISTLVGIQEFTNLTELNCSNNQLTDLFITSNDSLTILDCSNNQLTELNTSNNTALSVFNGSNNKFLLLDLSLNPNLTEVRCNSNQLFNFNVANGNTANISILASQGNAYLNCIEVDANMASGGLLPFGWTKDAHTSYSGSPCSICTVSIPDTNFKNALLNHQNTIDTDGNGEIECHEAAAFTGFLYVNSKNISDLTGIQAFINIHTLYCDDNSISTLDLSNMRELTLLFGQNNALTSISFSNNTSLTGVNIFNNQLQILDVSNLGSLESLASTNNDLVTLNIANGNNANLADMTVWNNPNLSCIKVDANMVGNIPSSWQTDAGVNFSENCLTSIETIENSTISIFPNPTQSTISILTTVSVEEVILYNLQGQVVLQTQNTNELDLSQLTKGAYILQVQTNQEIITQQVIKE